jgi:hypothetical protein
MNHTAKVDPAPSEVMGKVAKNETIRTLEHKPDSEHLTDAEILDDECSFVLSEN